MNWTPDPPRPYVRPLRIDRRFRGAPGHEEYVDEHRRAGARDLCEYGPPEIVRGTHAYGEQGLVIYKEFSTSVPADPVAAHVAGVLQTEFEQNGIRILWVQPVNPVDHAQVTAALVERGYRPPFVFAPPQRLFARQNQKPTA